MVDMTFKSIEDLLGHIAIIITGIGGVWLAIQAIIKPPKGKDDNTPQIVQGQSIPLEEPWVTDMRERNKILAARLEKALLRLSENDIDTHDI